MIRVYRASLNAWEPSAVNEHTRPFTAAYQKKFGRLPSYHSAAAYAVGQVAEAAIKAKGADRKALRDFIAGSEIDTVMGRFKVNERGQQTGYHYVSTQWQGTEDKVIGAGSSAQPIWPKPKWA